VDCCDESWTEVKGRKIKGKVTPPQLPKPKGFTLSDFISPSSFEELDKDDQDDNAKAKTKRTTTTTTTRGPPRSTTTRPTKERATSTNIPGFKESGKGWRPPTDEPALGETPGGGLTTRTARSEECSVKDPGGDDLCARVFRAGFDPKPKTEDCDTWIITYSDEQEILTANEEVTPWRPLWTPELLTTSLDPNYYLKE